MRQIDADALKYCLQNHYGVVEQDCGVSKDFVDGTFMGLDAAMFEIDSAPDIDAIPVEWLKGLMLSTDDDVDKVEFAWIMREWQKKQEAR